MIDMCSVKEEEKKKCFANKRKEDSVHNGGRKKFWFLKIQTIKFIKKRKGKINFSPTRDIKGNRFLMQLVGWRFESLTS